MARIKHLVEGEFTRLNKYNLFVASLFVGLLWVVMAYFLSLDELLAFLPFVFLMESSMMTAILVGAEMFYEKKEHTISSMLISPITQQEYLIAKILANILNLLIVFAIITVSVYLIRDFLFNIHWLVLSVSLVCAFYVIIGILLSYVSKDFTSLLINYMLLVMVLVMPTLLAMIGVIPADIRDWLFWGPTEVTLRLMQASFTTSVDVGQFALDFIYVVGFSAALTFGLVLPNFKAYATRDLGV